LSAACSRGGDSILIGVAGPFSQARGLSMKQAAQLAADEVNAQGGVRGRKLQLLFVDDSGNEDVAVRVAREFYDNPRVVAVLGHLSSNASIVAGHIYGSGSTPLTMITPSASSPDLSGLSRYVFRVTPNDLHQGEQLARFARQQIGARRTGVIYINNDYGRGLRRAFTATFANLGGEIIEEDPYLPATTSLEPYLERMRSRGVDLLMLAAERPGAELALREMARLGLRWPVVGGDALSGIETLGSLAEGIHYSAVYMPEQPGPRNAAFVAAYARAYDGQRPDHRGAGAYDIVHLLVRAIAQVGSDRSAIREYVAQVGAGGRNTFEGVTGTIAFDALGDVPSKAVLVGVVRGGRLVPAGEAR
jgi:branched-chain amino acid transport system substrate-binding protein